MSDEKADGIDRQSARRQNIYFGEIHGSEKLYSARQVADMTGYASVTVRLLARQLEIGKRIDGHPFFTINDIMELHQRREGGTELRVKKPREHRLPMDGRATMWELFQGNRSLIQQLENALAKVRETAWDLRKSISVLSGDLEDIKRRLGDFKQKVSGRGAFELARTTPLSPMNTGRLRRAA